ncbi:hydrogenase maturation nickel metallochaperone HypA [Campylobacter mucosalis]|uniref:hydrogenase maturation nickel metallochaperone HypA n=1 Tax=Campylobacter mucosalis TaxID=202 RepID=UPI0014703280|nr:hydrogenase maturation nickel metallochaperone HypA [Campylobacter mucosalis]
MHELSIAQNLLLLCEQNAQKQNASKITKIFIKIGRLSGVEPHYLESAFSVVKAQSVCDEAELTVHIQDVVIKCKKCLEQSTLSENEFICPKCGSNELEIVDGEDMYLMRLELES